MNIVETLAYLDELPELHESRLIILMFAFTGIDGTGAIEGLTKLAKLDFLLRYPVMLKRALEAKDKSIRDIKIEDYEMQNVESEMVRYRFGPWDYRYHSILNILVAKGLVKIVMEGRKIVISLTEKGIEFAKILTSNPEFEQYTFRSLVIKRSFDLTATNLMHFIYDTFPEIVSLNSGKRITL
jgi:hypothetical protein